MDGHSSFDKEYPHLREFKKFLDALNNESERGVALISVAMIDDLLERSILAFLIDHADVKRLLEGFNAPLGTFSARALAGLALGVLSETEQKECARLGKIRNIFAHNVHASFDDQNVRDLCATLEFSAKDYGEVHVHPRGQYSSSATSLILQLTNRPHYAAERRLQFRMWRY